MIPDAIAVAIIVLSTISFIFFNAITITEVYVIFFASIIFGGCYFALGIVRSKKVQPGSSRTEWAQSGAKEVFYDWSKVKRAYLSKTRGSRILLSMVLGNSIKNRRSLMQQIDSSS